MVQGAELCVIYTLNYARGSPRPKTNTDRVCGGSVLTKGAMGYVDTAPQLSPASSRVRTQ
jgi:hypothetical protein